MPQATDSGLDETLYEDESVTEESGDETETETVEASDSVDEEASKNPTALLPTSALGKSPKVGDSIRVKIVKLHGEEAEVEVSSTEDDETEEPVVVEEADELSELERM